MPNGREEGAQPAQQKKGTWLKKPYDYVMAFTKYGLSKGVGERIRLKTWLTGSEIPIERWLQKSEISSIFKDHIGKLDLLETKWGDFQEDMYKLMDHYAGVGIFRGFDYTNDEIWMCKFGPRIKELSAEQKEKEKEEFTKGGEKEISKHKAEEVSDNEVEEFLNLSKEKRRRMIAQGMPGGEDTLEWFPLSIKIGDELIVQEFPIPREVIINDWTSIINDRNRLCKKQPVRYFGFENSGRFIKNYELVIKAFLTLVERKLVATLPENGKYKVTDGGKAKKKEKDLSKEDYVKTNIETLKNAMVRIINNKYIEIIRDHEAAYYKWIRKLTKAHGTFIDIINTSLEEKNVYPIIKENVVFKRTYRYIGPEKILDARTYNTALLLYRELKSQGRYFELEQIAPDVANRIRNARKMEEQLANAIKKLNLSTKENREAQIRSLKAQSIQRGLDNNGFKKEKILELDYDPYMISEIINEIGATKAKGLLDECRVTPRDILFCKRKLGLTPDEIKFFEKYKAEWHFDTIVEYYNKYQYENEGNFRRCNVLLLKLQYVFEHINEELKRMNKPHFLTWSMLGGKRHPRERAPGLDENGWPFEVDHDNTILLDKWEYRTIPEVRDKSIRKIDKDYITDMEPLLKAIIMHGEFDAIRDDLRDGRYHKNSLTIYDYILAIMAKHGPESSRVIKKEDYLKRSERQLLRGEFEPRNEEDLLKEGAEKYASYTMMINNRQKEVKGIRRPSDLSPAFDRRCIKLGTVKSGWWHLGRKRYYSCANAILGDLRDEDLDNPYVGKYVKKAIGPTISTRGVSMYIIEKVLANMFDYEQIQLVLTRIAGKYWYDYGPREVGVNGPKNPFKPDPTTISAAIESLSKRRKELVDGTPSLNQAIHEYERIKMPEE